MTDLFESESFVLPSQVRENIAGRLVEGRVVKSLELLVKGDSLEETKDFSRLLVDLRRSGVRISHEFSIKLEFPKSISREKALAFVERMPKSKNGSLKVRIQLETH